MNYNNSFKGEKLVGRSNITEWFTNASLYLEINGYMPYIDGTEKPPLKSLYFSGETAKSADLEVRYYERLADFNRNSNKALGALKSIISVENCERFKDKTTATALWKAIGSTFSESSFELIGRYLD